MRSFNSVAAILCVSLIAGCATQKLPTRIALNDDAKVSMAGVQLVPVVEPAPAITRRINKRFVSTGGAGGLIGLGISLTATLVSAAVENASSDIDDIPALTEDMAAIIQAELMNRIVEKTGVVYDPAVSIPDPGRSMDFLTSGKENLMAAAKKAGHTGVILDVRTQSQGILSSGIRSAGDEQFTYVTIMEAGLIKATTGDVIGRSKCIFTSPAATRLKLEADRKRIAEAYEVALREQETELPANSEDPEYSEAVSKKQELPPKTFEEDIVRKTVKRCLRTFERELL